jgi:hypothetical protein
MIAHRGLSTGTAEAISGRTKGVRWAASLTPMTILDRVYDIPDDDELAQLVGAATPHFALQIRERVASFAKSLPQDHPRQAELQLQLERLERLASGGETGGSSGPDLPPRSSLGGAR